jgi:hypothetical protein
MTFPPGSLVILTYCDPLSEGYLLGLRVGDIGTVRRVGGCGIENCPNCAFAESALVQFPALPRTWCCARHVHLRKIDGEGRQVVDWDWRSLNDVKLRELLDA